MEFVIITTGKETIYEQIIIQIKLAIAKGQLKIGDMLPSVRSLAKSLSVSTLSVQRAYTELQKEGIIESAEGKGNFVSANVSKSSLRDTLIKAVEAEVQSVIRLTKQNGVEKHELSDLIEILWEDN